MKKFILEVTPREDVTGLWALTLDGTTHTFRGIEDGGDCLNMPNCYSTAKRRAPQQISELLVNLGFSITDVTNIVTATIFVDSISVSDTDDVLVSSNVSEDNSFRIINVVDSPNSVDYGTKFKATITTSTNIDKVIKPVIANDVADTTFEMVLDRGFAYEIELVGEDGTTVIGDSQGVPLPISDTDISLVQDKGILVVNVDKHPDLTLEYKLNGGAWTTINRFIDPDLGTNTIYVRDQYLFEVNKQIDIVNYIESPSTQLIVPKENSLVFKKVNELASNDLNTVSCEADDEMPFENLIYLNDLDVVTTQVKCATQPTVLFNGKIEPVVKKSDNLNKSDCSGLKVNSDGSRQKIYFLGDVDKYSQDCLSVIDTVNYEGALPEWAIPDAQLSIIKVGGTVIPLTIEYTGKHNGIEVYDYLVFKEDVIVEDTDKISIHYQLNNTEVWEFTINGAEVSSKSLVEINVINQKGKELKYISESIVNINNYPRIKFVKIRYKNNANTDMYYGSGIINIINVPFISSIISDENEVISYVGDTTVHNISRKNVEVNTYSFDITTKAATRRLAIALTRTNVSINDVGCILKEISPDNIEGTNLYTTSATMYMLGDADDDLETEFNGGWVGERFNGCNRIQTIATDIEGLFLPLEAGASNPLTGDIYGLGGIFAEVIYAKDFVITGGDGTVPGGGGGGEVTDLTFTQNGDNILLTLKQEDGSDVTSNVLTITTSSGDKHLEYSPPSASAIWTVPHNLSKFPSVSVVDSGGTMVEGMVEHTDSNNLKITFNAAFLGTAYLN